MIRVHCTELNTLTKGNVEYRIRFWCYVMLSLSMLVTAVSRIERWIRSVTDLYQPLLNTDWVRMYVCVRERIGSCVFPFELVTDWDSNVHHVSSYIFMLFNEYFRNIYKRRGSCSAEYRSSMIFKGDEIEERTKEMHSTPNWRFSVHCTVYNSERTIILVLTSSGTFFVSLSIFVIVKCFKSYGLETKLFCSQPKKRYEHWTTKNTKHQMPNARNQLNM